MYLVCGVTVVFIRLKLLQHNLEIRGSYELMLL